MAEQLGEAILVLRTDDRGLEAGIDKAEAKGKGLGRTLDDTSASADALGKKLDATGTEAADLAGAIDKATVSATKLDDALDNTSSSATRLDGTLEATSASTTKLDGSMDALAVGAAGIGRALDTMSAAATRIGQMLDTVSGSASRLDGVIEATSTSAAGLGAALQATSGDVNRIGTAVQGAGTNVVSASQKTGEYSAAVARLKAEVDPAWGALQKFKDQAKLARDAMDAGAITGKQYVQFMRDSAAAAGLLNTAGRNVTVMSGEQRVGFRQLGMQLGDMSTMYSLGAKPMQIIASQADQVIQAVQLMTAGTSKFATFMGGPWGIALSTGAMLLVPLIGNLLDSKSAADKAAEAHETLVQKLDLTKHSLQDVLTTLREYNAEQEKSKTTTLQAAEAVAAKIEVDLRAALALRDKLAAQLDADQVTANVNAGQGTGGVAGAAAGLQVVATQQKIAANEAAIKATQDALKNANAALADAQAKINSDPIANIKERYDRLRETAKATIADVTTLTARLTALNTQEKAATEAEQKRQADAKREANAKDSPADQASIGDMTALIQQLFPGARITSTTGGKHVSGSDHYAGRAIDFVPQGGMGQYSTAEVEKMLEDAGVTIRRSASGKKQFFGPGLSASTPGDHDDHYHVAWTGGASPEEADKRAAAAKAQAARKAEEAQRVQEEYDRDLAGLGKELLSLRGQMATTLEERYRIEQQALDAALAEQRRQITDNPKFSQAQKDALLAQLAIKASLEQQLLDRRKHEDFAKQDLEVAQALKANEMELLQKQLGLTEIREKRKAIEEQLLEESYKQQKAALEATIASQTATELQKRDAADKLAKLDQNRSLDQKGLDQKYQSPIQRYIHDISGVGTSINDSMQNVAVDGLKQLDDGLVGVIMRSKSLGDAFKDVANRIIEDLVRIAVERAIIAPLANLFAGGSSGGGGGGFFGSILSGIGSIFGGAGGSGGMVAAPTSVSPMMSFVGPRAMGGLIPSGKFGIVGEHGPEPVFATSDGAMVKTASSLSQLGGGDNSAKGPSKLEVAVSGARGNAEIEQMVRSGVAQGLAAYDKVVADRVREHVARRG